MPMPSPAFDVVEALVSAPRQSAVLGMDDGVVLVRTEMPTGRNTLTSRLVLFKRSGQEWTPAAALTAVTGLCLGFGDILLVCHEGGGSRLSIRSASGEVLPLCDVPARVSAVSYDPCGGTLACIARSPVAPPADGPLGLADVAHFPGAEASVGSSRRRDDKVQVWTVGLDRGAQVQAQRLETGAVCLTGECTWSAGRLVLGVVRDLADGRRRFGLVVRETDGAMRTIMDDRLDLSAPYGRPGSFAVVCLGTTVPDHADDHPRQLVAVVDESGKIGRITDGQGLWEQPRGWAGTDAVLTLAEDGPHRRLFLRSLNATVSCDLSQGLSVLDVIHDPGSGHLALLVSSIDQPPHLVVGRLGLQAGYLRLEHADDDCGAVRPGRLRRIELPDPQVSVPLAAWLVEPVTGTGTGSLVVIFHGGPLKSWTDWPWRWNPWPYAAAGSTVALVEPPMSLGYGNEAVAAGWRRWREGIVSVAHRQVRRIQRETGLTHAPLVLMGGSFGGYMALSAARELKPKLVVAHGSLGDLATVAGSSDVGWQWLREYGEPELNRELYERSSLPPYPISPGTRLLLSHGLHDDLVPVQESVRIHRQCVRGGARSELAVFRNEGHPLLRPDNLRGWFRWVLRAFEEEGIHW